MRSVLLAALVLAACGGSEDRLPTLRDSNVGPGQGSGSSSTSGSALDDELTCGDNHLHGTSPGSDVIIAVDSSGSMTTELPGVDAALGNWLPRLVNGGARVVLLGAGICKTGNCTTTGDPTVLHLPAGIVSTNSLSVVMDHYPLYRDHLRVGAPKHLVFFTDDNATAPNLNHAPSFAQGFANLDPASDFTAHAAICSEAGGECDMPGTVYAELAALTGGQLADVAAGAFDVIFNEVELTADAPAALPCAFDFELEADEQVIADELSVIYERPNGTSEPIPAADGSCDGSGYTLDDLEDPLELTLCPASCDMVADGGALQITLPCEERLLD